MVRKSNLVDLARWDQLWAYGCILLISACSGSAPGPKIETPEDASKPNLRPDPDASIQHLPGRSAASGAQNATPRNKVGVVNLHALFRPGRIDFVALFQKELGALDLSQRSEIEELQEKGSGIKERAAAVPGTALQKELLTQQQVVRGEIEVVRKVHEYLVEENTQIMIREVYRNIRPVIEEICKERGYDRFQELGEPVLVGTPDLRAEGNLRREIARNATWAVDITDDVIRRLADRDTLKRQTPFLTRKAHPEVELLVRADRLWESDENTSIRLYKDLLGEYSNSPIVRRHWIRISKRAEQGD